jgi:BirA family biotin operon repressor/biotin-[acetyl-CoA-carboxylase] ligase
MKNPVAKIDLLPFVERVFHFDTIDSTNTFAKNLTTFPEKGLLVVYADSQTEGRGQRQSTFFSGARGGLFASIVCPIPDIGSHFNYNRAISLAIYDGVKDLSPSAPLAIKWPNDVYWGDRKLCGILPETVPGRTGIIVIGFGINVNIARTTFPNDIKSVATSLLIETKKRHDVGALLEAIVERFWKYLSLPPNAAHLLYTNRLYKTGSTCMVNGRIGVFKGVLQDGRMRLSVGGRDMLVSSGPVRFTK